jgi:transposase
LSDPLPSPEPLDPELAERLKALLPGPVLEQLNGSLSREQQRLLLTQEQLRFAQYKVRVLEERLRLIRIQKYGPGSEKLSDAQLELLEAEPGVSAAEVAAEGQREPLVAPRPAKPRRPHPGRQEWPADLPRVEQLIACGPEQCVCHQCGRPTVVIGYEQSEQLDVEPAKYFVLVTKREKRACKACEEQGVACAPLPARIIEKGLASDRVVIDAVVRKYADFLPLYRQSVILERETGLSISRATLDGWVMQVGELLRPMSAAMRQELLSGPYLQADETPVEVQSGRVRGKNHQAYLWQYSRPGGPVVFDFRMGRDRSGPKAFLGNFEGLLQTDGYAAYEQVGGPKLVHVACWSHARRKFFEALEANPQDAAARGIVAHIDRLFAIDGQAREAGLDPPARDALRQAHAKPLVAELKSRIEAARCGALPKSLLAKACAYTLNLWGRLTRFLEHPEVELSTNLAENSMRPVALGRRNWLHRGSEPAGPRVAAILSAVESCRRLKVPVRDYLAGRPAGLGRLAAAAHRRTDPGGLDGPS